MKPPRPVWGPSWVSSGPPLPDGATPGRGAEVPVAGSRSPQTHLGGAGWKAAVEGMGGGGPTLRVLGGSGAGRSGADALEARRGGGHPPPFTGGRQTPPRPRTEG